MTARIKVAYYSYRSESLVAPSDAQRWLREAVWGLCSDLALPHTSISITGTPIIEEHPQRGRTWHVSVNADPSAESFIAMCRHAEGTEIEIKVRTEPDLAPVAKYLEPDTGDGVLVARMINDSI